MSEPRGSCPLLAVFHKFPVENEAHLVGGGALPRAEVRGAEVTAGRAAAAEGGLSFSRSFRYRTPMNSGGSARGLTGGWRRLALLAMLSLTASAQLSACKPGAAAQVVQPTPTSATEAMGEAQCREVPPRGASLIVDWGSHERANLEEAMASGIAVVSFSCKKLELLAECNVPGAYGYMGVTTKEDTIQLASSDEIQANLPLGGAKIAAGLARGSTLDLALIQVGKLRTAVTAVARATLPKSERCAGATHFVRGAHVGAFAMNAGTVGKTRAAAELFGVGASGESQSAKSVARRDGSPASCGGADAGATAAPRGCSAVLRLELIAIDSPKIAGGEAPAAEANGCPAGLVRAGGKCAPERAGQAFDCSPEHPEECRKQCDRGSMASCASLALALHYGAGGVERDLNQAGALYNKACAAGEQMACSGLAMMLLDGVGGVPRDVARSLDLTQRACAAGDARGCNNLGVAYHNGKGVAVDRPRAAALYERACAGGSSTGCSNLGVALRDGLRGTRDPRRALENFEVACNASSPTGCTLAGLAFRGGAGAPPDATLAAARFQRACDLEKSPMAGEGCRELATQYLDGKGVERGVERAVALLQQGCSLGHSGSCHALADLHRKGAQIPRSDIQANRVLDDACRAGVGDACAWLGEAYAAGLGVAKSPAQAIENYEKSCDLRSGWGCVLLGGARWDALGGPADRAAAGVAWERGCDLFDAGACHRLAWSLENGQGARVDFARAVALYEVNCERGGGDSCMNVGTMYLTGRGVPASDTKALSFLERACESGVPGACNNAGVLYRRGGASPKNDLRAAALFEIGCRGKDSQACFNLARAYRQGEGVPRDPGKEAESAKAACVLGQTVLCRLEWVDEVCSASLEACTQMAYKLAQGKEPFKLDAKRGFSLFQRACNGGHPNGCYGLGDAHDRGWGTPKSADKARASRARACELGLKTACK